MYYEKNASRFRFDQLNIVSGDIPSPPRALFLCVSVGVSLPTWAPCLLRSEDEYENEDGVCSSSSSSSTLFLSDLIKFFLLSLYCFICYFLFFQFSCDYSVFISSLLIPPGVVDDDSFCDDDADDEATEVQTNFVPSQKFAMIPPLLVILNASKPYQTWYTQSNVGVLASNRREYKRNHIKILLGLWDFPPPLLIFLLLCCYFCFHV